MARKVTKPIYSSEKGNSKRDALIIKYQRYVESLAGKMVRKMGLPREHFDDFVSAGNMGLIEAASRYDENSDTAFQSYAYMRIKGAIIDSIRRNSELSGKAYRLAKALESRSGLRDDDEINLAHETVGAIGVNRSKNKIEGRKATLARVLDYGLKGVIAFRLAVDDAEEEISKSAEDATPENELLDAEKSALFKQIVERLPEKERHIIKEHYFNDKSFNEIVDEERGLSKSWVSRLHSRAIDLIRTEFMKEMATQEKI